MLFWTCDVVLCFVLKMKVIELEIHYFFQKSKERKSQVGALLDGLFLPPKPQRPGVSGGYVLDLSRALDFVTRFNQLFFHHRVMH